VRKIQAKRPIMEPDEVDAEPRQGSLLEQAMP